MPSFSASCFASCAYAGMTSVKAASDVEANNTFNIEIPLTVGRSEIAPVYAPRRRTVGTILRSRNGRRRWFGFNQSVERGVNSPRASEINDVIKVMARLLRSQCGTHDS